MSRALQASPVAPGIPGGYTSKHGAARAGDRGECSGRAVRGRHLHRVRHLPRARARCLREPGVRAVVRAAAALGRLELAAGAARGGELPHFVHRRGAEREGSRPRPARPSRGRGVSLWLLERSILRCAELLPAAQGREPPDRFTALRRPAHPPHRRAGRRPQHVPHPPRRRRGPCAVPGALRLRADHPPRRCGDRGGGAARWRPRAGAGAASDPPPRTYARKLRAAGGRQVPLHRRPPLGLGGSPGDGAQRFLVLVDRAEEVPAQVARLPLRVGSPRTRAQLAPSRAPHAGGGGRAGCEVRAGFLNAEHVVEVPPLHENRIRAVDLRGIRYTAALAAVIPARTTARAIRGVLYAHPSRPSGPATMSPPSPCARSRSRPTASMAAARGEAPSRTRTQAARARLTLRIASPSPVELAAASLSSA